MNQGEIERARNMFIELQGLREKKSIVDGQRFLQIQEDLMKTRRLIEVRA